MQPADLPHKVQEEAVSDWGERLKALGGIQSRYTWWMLLVSLFAIALHARFVDCGLFASDPAPFGSCAEPILAPLLGVELSPLVLWAATPSLIALLASTLLGSINAAAEALVKMGKLEQWGGAPSDYVDVQPNSIDLAAFVHPAFGRSGFTKALAAILNWLSRRRYTLFVGLALIEAAYINWHSYTLRSEQTQPIPGHDIFWLLAFVFIAMAVTRMLYMVRLSMRPVPVT